MEFRIKIKIHTKSFVDVPGEGAFEVALPEERNKWFGEGICLGDWG